MRKHDQNHKDKAIPSLPEGAVHLLDLVAVGYISLPFVVIHPSFAEPYDIIFRFGILATFALTFVATLVALRGQASKLLLKALRLLASLAALVLVILLFGALQNAVGIKCSGFFSTTPNCVNSWALSLQLMFFSPVVFVPLALAFNTAFIIGLKQSLRRQEG